MSCSPASKRWLPDVPRWVAAGQKIQKLISSWLTRSAIKEAKVKIVHLNDIDNCTVYITPTSCLCWPFAVNRWSHCFYICRCRSKQHHDSAKGEGTQLRSRLQDFPWLRYTKWKRRHAISTRTKTTLAQGLPADMEDKVVEFHRFVVRAEWRGRRSRRHRRADWRRVRDRQRSRRRRVAELSRAFKQMVLVQTNGSF